MAPPAAWRFTRTGDCWFAWPGAVLRRSIAGGRQTWLTTTAEDQPLHCLTSVAVAPDGTIFLTDGTTAFQPDDWCRDLMAKNHLGRLVACGPGSEAPRVLLRDLFYPNGLAIAAGELWFTEAWNHRVSRATIDGRGIKPPQTVIGNLPGYPARLGPASGGGFWLALFACAHASRRVRAA